MGGSLEGSGRSYGALRTVRRRQNGLDLKCGGSETSWGPGRLLWQVSVLALGEFGRPSTSQLQGHIANHLTKCSQQRTKYLDTFRARLQSSDASIVRFAVYYSSFSNIIHRYHSVSSLIVIIPFLDILHKSTHSVHRRENTSSVPV